MVALVFIQYACVLSAGFRTMFINKVVAKPRDISRRGAAYASEKEACRCMILLYCTIHPASREHTPVSLLSWSFFLHRAVLCWLCMPLPCGVLCYAVLPHAVPCGAGCACP